MASGDDPVARCLEIDVAYTDDRRLASLGVTATGNVGEALKAGLSLVSAGADLLAGGTPAAAVAKLLLPAGGAAARRLREPPPAAVADQELPPEERVARRYAQLHRDAAEQVKSWPELRRKIRTALLEARHALVEAIAEPGAVRGSSIGARRPRMLGPSAREVWDQLGIVVARDEEHSDQPDGAEIVHGKASQHGIWVRHPRLLVLKVMARGADGQPVVERTEPRSPRGPRRPRRGRTRRG